MNTLQLIVENLEAIVKSISEVNTPGSGGYVFYVGVIQKLRDTVNELKQLENSDEVRLSVDEVRPSVLYSLLERVDNLEKQNAIRRNSIDTLQEMYIALATKHSILAEQVNNTGRQVQHDSERSMRTESAYANRYDELFARLTHTIESLAALEKQFSDFSSLIDAPDGSICTIQDTLQKLSNQIRSVADETGKRLTDVENQLDFIDEDVDEISSGLVSLERKITSINHRLPNHAETRLHDLEIVVNKLKAYHNKRCDKGKEIKYYIETPCRSNI